MKTTEEKRNYNRAYLANRRANRTPEQKEADRAYQRAYRAQRKEREDKALEKFQQNNDYEEMKELFEKRGEKKAKAKEAQAKFHAANPDYHKNYYRENREKMLARNKETQPNYLENLDLTDETISNKTRLNAWGRQVKLRDENRCYYHSEECSKKIDAHHILPKEWKSKSSLHNFATMKFSLSNGQTLCRKHHMAVHKEMKKWLRE